MSSGQLPTVVSQYPAYLASCRLALDEAIYENRKFYYMIRIPELVVKVVLTYALFEVAYETNSKLSDYIWTSLSFLGLLVFKPTWWTDKLEQEFVSLQFWDARVTEISKGNYTQAVTQISQEISHHPHPGVVNMPAHSVFFDSPAVHFPSLQALKQTPNVSKLLFWNLLGSVFFFHKCKHTLSEETLTQENFFNIFNTMTFIQHSFLHGGCREESQCLFGYFEIYKTMVRGICTGGFEKNSYKEERYKALWQEAKLALKPLADQLPVSISLGHGILLFLFLLQEYINGSLDIWKRYVTQAKNLLIESGHYTEDSLEKELVDGLLAAKSPKEMQAVLQVDSANRQAQLQNFATFKLS